MIRGFDTITTASLSKGKVMTTIAIQQRNYTVVWEKLPLDFVLPDDPVENINQPLLAAALSEALDLAGVLTSEMMVASNLGICTKINGEISIKAPDWLYISRVFPVAKGTVRRSYTPHTEGDIPAIVMEFLSHADSGEYSLRPTYPYGKMWFYEQIVKIPTYVTFDTESGLLEVRCLQAGSYEIQQPNAQGHYFLPDLGLFLGVWEGTRLETTAYWLRWWDESGNLLLWGAERIERERQKVRQERQRAEAAERQLAALQERLRQAGIEEES